MIQNANQRELASIRNRKIGFIFQFFNLLPKLNVLQNVELPMVYSGMPGRQRREMAMEALKQVGLEKRSKHRTIQLSGAKEHSVTMPRALENSAK